MKIKIELELKNITGDFIIREVVGTLSDFEAFRSLRGDPILERDGKQFFVNIFDVYKAMAMAIDKKEKANEYV